jgi:solute carrier family 25 citrate transporter 1
MLKQMAEGYVAPGEKLGTASTFALGGIAGIITVYAGSVSNLPVLSELLIMAQTRYVTQPLDTVKTRFVSPCSGEAISRGTF